MLFWVVTVIIVFLIIAFSSVSIKIDLSVIDRSISVELLQDIVNVITSLLFSYGLSGFIDRPGVPHFLNTITC